MGRKLTYIKADCRAAANAGDKEAINAIINHYMPYIQSLAKSTVIKYCDTVNAELEEDLIQELILELIKGSRRFKEARP